MWYNNYLQLTIMIVYIYDNFVLRMWINRKIVIDIDFLKIVILKIWTADK